MSSRFRRRAMASLALLLTMVALLTLPATSILPHATAATPDSPRQVHSPSSTANLAPTRTETQAPLAPRPANGTGGNGSGGGGGSGTGGTGTITGTGGPWVDLTPNLTTLPKPRQSFGMAYDPLLSAIVLFGGQDTFGSELGDTWEYVNGSWVDLTSTLTTAPSARYGPGLTYDASQQAILLFGGRTSAGTYFNDTWTFNATGWHDLGLSVAPQPRTPSTSMVYDAVDGYTLLHGAAHGSTYQETWKFQNGSWSNITSLQTGTLPALGFIGVYDAADGYVVFYGGDRAGCTGAALTWKYAANKWTNLTSTAGTPTAAMGSGAITYDENLSAVVMFGGYTASCTVVAETWTFVSGKWSQASTPAPIPPGTWDGRLAWDAAADSDILVGGNGAAVGGSNSFVNDTWAFYAGRLPPASATVSPLAGPGPLSVTFTVNAVASVAKLPLAINWSLGDGSANLTTSPASHTYSVVGKYTVSVFVRDSAGRVLSGSVIVLVNPKPKGTWLELISSTATVTTPAGRQAFAMQYDPLLGESILFGGQDTSGNALGDTWSFAGGAWTQLTPASSPANRWGVSMAYDPAENGIVLFGGRDQSFNYYNDTWLYNASGWHNITPAGASPSPRNADGKLVYDAADGYLLLYGGANYYYGSYTDTWKFESGKWTDLTSSVTGSPPSYIGQGAYDAADGYVVYYGGAGSCAGPSVTWTYLAGAWTDLTSTAGSPTAAAGPGTIAYDPIEKGVVISGGYDNYCDVTNQTWVFRAGSWGDITNYTGGANPPGRWDARATFVPTLGGELVFGGNENSQGGSNTFHTDTWLYHDGLNVTARVNQSAGITPMVVNFSASSITGGQSPYFYNWTFGDGSPNSTLASPSHTYSAIGAYTATLQVNDSSGRFGSALIGLHVYPTLAVQPTVTPSTGEAPLPVSFTANGTGGVPPTSFHWQFGDGNSSIVRTTSHTYTRGGNFTWNLTYLDSKGNAVSMNGTIAVVPALSVSMATVGGPGEVPLTVLFNSTTTGGLGPFTYNWSFGDGSFGGNARSVSHVYDRAGAFSAWCNVTDALRVTRSAHTIILVLVPLVAGTSATPVSGEAPLSVQFGAAPSGGQLPYSIAWNFGDGSQSTLAAVTHTYTTVGNYTATVTVTDGLNYTATKSYTITVAAPLAVVLASSPSRGLAPVTVTFDPSSTGGVYPLSYLWSFGDGSTSTTAGPVTHTFVTPGTFTTSLTVSDADGVHVHTTAVVSVAAHLTATLSGNVSSVLVGIPVDLTARVSGGFPGFSYAWSNLPSGCTSQNASSLVCTPTQPGNYSISVTATDLIGDQANATTALQVLPQSSSPTGTSQGPSLPTMWIIIGAVAALAAVAAAVLLLRRRRANAPAPPAEEPAPEYEGSAAPTEPETAPP